MPYSRPCPPVKSYLSKVGVWLAPPSPLLTLLSGDQTCRTMFPKLPGNWWSACKSGFAQQAYAMLGEGTTAPAVSVSHPKPSHRWSFQVSEQLLVQTLMPGLQLRAEILQLPGESSNSCEAGSCRDLEISKAQSRACPPAPPPKLISTEFPILNPFCLQDLEWILFPALTSGG